MTDETFQLGQIWQRGRYHGLLVKVVKDEYTVFNMELQSYQIWIKKYMVEDVRRDYMRLIA